MYFLLSLHLRVSLWLTCYVNDWFLLCTQFKWHRTPAQKLKYAFFNDDKQRSSASWVCLFVRLSLFEHWPVKGIEFRCTQQAIILLLFIDLRTDLIFFSFIRVTCIKVYMTLQFVQLLYYHVQLVLPVAIITQPSMWVCSTHMPPNKIHKKAFILCSFPALCLPSCLACQTEDLGSVGWRRIC